MATGGGSVFGSSPAIRYAPIAGPEESMSRRERFTIYTNYETHRRGGWTRQMYLACANPATQHEL